MFWRVAQRRVICAVAGIVGVVWSTHAEAQAPKGPSVYVADTRILGDTKQDSTLRANVTPLNDAFAYALMSANCSSVETADDARRRLGAERGRQLTGNATDSSSEAAMQRMANAVSADRLAYATVGHIGNSWTVTGTVLDPRNARALGRASTTAQNVSQIPAALRRLGQQLARSAAVSGGGSRIDTYTAKYKSVQRVKGQPTLITMDGTMEATPEAVRVSIAGKFAQLFQLLLMVASGDTAAAERAMAAPPAAATPSLWMLVNTETAETHIVDDASRSYLTLVSEGMNEQIAQTLGPLGVAFGKDMQSAFRDMGLKVGAGDPGKIEMRNEKMDIRAYRVQDSVWVSFGSVSCAEFDSAGLKPKSGLTRCGKEGMMEVRLTTGERTQADSVNGMLTEHWQLYNEVRATLRHVGATGFFATIPGYTTPQRMDSKMVYDVWVPRGAGYCLSPQGYSAFSPMQGMFDKFDKDFGIGSNFGDQWERFMTAMRQIPGTGTRTVTRQWTDNDIDAKEPSIVVQGDVYDIRTGSVDRTRLKVPATYRKVELPKPRPEAVAGGTAGGSGSGAKGGDGDAKNAESKNADANTDEAKGESVGDKAAKAVKDEAKATVDEVKADAKGEVRSTIDEAKQKAKDAVKDKLKGLFKKP